MISLSAVENNISKLILSNEDNHIDFIATSIEDEKKGEKIILLISNVDELFVSQLKEKMIANFDNKLMLPSEIKIVNDIPKLGTGKKDFKGAKELAKECFY